jgi:hypothetical protein
MLALSSVGRIRVSDFYVEFEIASEEQLDKLSEVFAALVAAKTGDDWKDDPYWLVFFDDAAKRNFWWPTDAVLKDWGRRWSSTPLETRWTDPSLRTKWLFGSLIDAFCNGEYDLLGCRQTSDGRGRIEFDPYGWPYGGTECMRVLAESFGHRVVDVRE